MDKERQTIDKIKYFIKKRKGSCITAACLVVILIFSIIFVDFETVSQHKEKKTDETKKRQEILAKLEEEKEVSQAAVDDLASAEGQDTLPDSSGAALSNDAQDVDSQTGTMSEQPAVTQEVRAADNQQPQSQTMPDVQTQQEGLDISSANTVQGNSGKTESGVSNPEKPVSSSQNVTAQEEDEYITVQMKITCEKVINHPDLKTAAKLPADGILFEGKTVVKKGGSVLDALEAVCTDYGIAYVNKGSASGAYITSIGGLAEKDCGGYSGWKFKVNDVVGGRSANAQKLNAGDRVEWYFAATYTD